MKRKVLYSWLLVCMAVVLCAVAAPVGAQSLSKGEGDLRVMTYNVDEGTDYTELQHARNATEFLVAVGQTITQVRATDPPGRMQAVARQIIAARPALVSLQELDQWATGAFDPVNRTCGPVSVEFDMLPELMDALASQGAHYKIAVQSQNWVVPPVPGLILPQTLLCVQVVDYIAILARTGIPSKLQWGNEQHKQFDNILIFHTAVGDVPFARAWISIDATYNGKNFRFIGTHLESVDAGIRELQGEEIRLGPANTSLPVMVAMDSNAPAYPLPQDPTYVDFIAAGYRDVWSEARPQDPGLTCCQAQFVDNLDSELYQRIDLILTLGNAKAQRAALFGVTQSSKTPAGLWPSDHAGVAAQVVIESGR
jgi:hypothetical protein